MTAPIQVLYFAWLRERIGRSGEDVHPPESVRTLGALMAWLATQSPGHAAAFGPENRVRCALNQEFAGPEAALKPGDEVAFFPPVTGG